MRLVAIAAIFAIALIAIPFAAGANDVPIGAASSAIMVGAGILIGIVAALAAIIFNLYQKTTPARAFVRTGMGKAVVVMDGGAIVVPVVHEITHVPLGTLKLVVDRKGDLSLTTKNGILIDIIAEFFVHVKADDPGIQTAAKTFGNRLNDERERSELIGDKLVSALRTVAAIHTIEELNEERAKIIAAVSEGVRADLQQNGLELESVTISYLNQTPLEYFREDNVLNARGRAVVAEVTQAQLTLANDKKKQGEQDRATRDVEAVRAILLQQQSQAEAEAEQKAAIARADQKSRQEQSTAQINADRELEVIEQTRQQTVQVAEQDREKAVQVATVDREKTIAVAKQDREKAEQVAEQTRLQDVQVAEQTRQQMVADAAANRAKATEEQAKAEALAETARQSITTVQVVTEAERKGKQQVIAATAEADLNLVKVQKTAEGDAFKVTKKAQADREAADAAAMAITTKAKADADAVVFGADAARQAKVAEAAGALAVAKVPVDVKNAEVDVASRQVAVDKTRLNDVTVPELAAKDQYGRVAIDLEIAKVAITAGANVAIETAKAAAQIGQHIKMNLFGTSETASSMLNSVLAGQRGGSFMEEFLRTAPPVVQQALGKAVALIPSNDTAATEAPKTE